MNCTVMFKDKFVLVGRDISGTNYFILFVFFLYGYCSFPSFVSYLCELTVLTSAIFFRDYTNPYLPVASSAIDGSGQVNICE